MEYYYSYTGLVALVVSIFLPLLFMLVVMPGVIDRLVDGGHVVKDMYKRDLPDVPTGGGLLILLVVMLGLSFCSLFFRFDGANYAFMVVLCLFGLFGLFDDMVDIGRAAKLVLLYYCSYPLIQFVPGVSLPLLGDLGLFYLQFVVPTYVLVVANLVNMHSGYNGLASGTSAIILALLVLKTFLVGDLSVAYVGAGILGATLGFYWFNRFPSRVFWGNVGALTVGAAIGGLIVLEGFVVSGFIMLIPHTVNFLLWVYWKMNMHRIPYEKFGRERENGVLWVPNPLTLKWVLPYYYRVTERQATHAMFALTGVFGVLGLIMPG